MTQDEIIEMARQAGWTGIFSQWISPTERQHLTVPVTIEQIEAFAKLVDAKATAKEREACVKAYEAEADTWKAWPQAGIAKRKGVAAIRARGVATLRGEQQ